jgi:hypothetical protein
MQFLRTDSYFLQLTFDALNLYTLVRTTLVVWGLRLAISNGHNRSGLKLPPDDESTAIFQ